MNTWRNALFCGSAIIAVGISFEAAAQTPSTRKVEEIVVTAQRRAEALENVPMSVTAVTPETIAKSGISGMEDLNKIAVGVQLNFGGSYFQPAIRGVTTLTNGAQAENNVGVYVDGFYDPSSVTINADFANVESIQVLKGPQGTLYGRNATGGAILINTLGPSKTFTGKLEASYGRFDDKRFTGFLAGPISDTTRFSVAGYYRQSPGYSDLVSRTVIGQTVGKTGEVKKASVDVKLQADLSDDLVATLGYSYGFLKDDRTARFDVIGSAAGFLPPPPARAGVFGKVAYDYPSYLFVITNRGSLKLDWNTGIGNLVSTTGYTTQVHKQQSDFDGTYFSIFFFGSLFKSEIFQQGLDYNITAIDNVDLLIGGLYYKHKLYTRPFIGAPTGILQGAGGVNASYATLRQNSRSWAVYLDATYHATDQLAITAGGRYSHDSKSKYYQNRAALPGGVEGAFFAGPVFNDVTWTKFTPRVNVRYEVSPGSNVYASYQQGFRNGNYDGGAPNSQGLLLPNKPESIDAFEIGYKTVRDNLRFEAAAFYYKYHDIQVNVVIPDPVTGSPSNTFSNGPGAKIYGAEVDLTYTPVEDLNTHFAVAWLHGRYDAFPNAAGTGLNGATNTNATNVTQDWSGKRLARAPDFTANFAFDYTTRFADQSSLTFAANVNFSTAFALNNASLYDAIVNGVNLAPVALRGKQRYQQDKMALVNAQLTWNSPDENYFVQIWGRNLTNHSYRLNFNGSAFGDYSPKAEPITFGGKVGVKF